MGNREDQFGRQRRACAAAMVLLAGVSWGCGQRIERARSTTPSGDCSATIRDHFRNPFSFDANVEVEVECRGRGIARYQGTNDWRYRSSAVRWDLKARRVAIPACGKISSPVYAEFGLAPVALERVKSTGIPASPPTDDGDRLLWTTCYADEK